MMDSNRDVASRLPGDLWSALALLTRLPVPNHAPRGADAAWAWPVVGIVIGGIAALVVVLATFIGLPAGVTAALALATMAILTGALHEDGLADTADGFFGGRDPVRRLAIMKDSHIGSFGTLALILVTLARWSALAALCATGGAAMALIATGALSRVPMVALMAALPNARGSGLSQSVGRPDRGVVLIAVGISGVLGLVLAGWIALWIVLALAALTLGLGQLARRKIRGQTGDVLGASQQLAEALCLALLAAA